MSVCKGLTRFGVVAAIAVMALTMILAMPSTSYAMEDSAHHGLAPPTANASISGDQVTLTSSQIQLVALAAQGEAIDAINPANVNTSTEVSAVSAHVRSSSTVDKLAASALVPFVSTLLALGAALLVGRRRKVFSPLRSVFYDGRSRIALSAPRLD